MSPGKISRACRAHEYISTMFQVQVSCLSDLPYLCGQFQMRSHLFVQLNVHQVDGRVNEAIYCGFITGNHYCGVSNFFPITFLVWRSLRTHFIMITGFLITSVHRPWYFAWESIKECISKFDYKIKIRLHIRLKCKSCIIREVLNEVYN